METLKELSVAYRKFLLELGEQFSLVKKSGSYEGFADTFIDCVKSPEIGFTTSEVNTLMKMYHKFCLLEPEDLPSHNNMKLMVNKAVDMDMLADAQTLSTTDFKEKIKDDETGTQERTYSYEVIKRCVETGNIKRVYDEERDEAIRALTNTD